MFKFTVAKTMLAASNFWQKYVSVIGGLCQYAMIVNLTMIRQLGQKIAVCATSSLVLWDTSFENKQLLRYNFADNEDITPKHIN